MINIHSHLVSGHASDGGGRCVSRMITDGLFLHLAGDPPCQVDHHSLIVGARASTDMAFVLVEDNLPFEMALQRRGRVISQD